MAKSDSFRTKLASLFSGRNFFRFILALLIVQAAWIALSGRYPMAFDEDFHLGIIKLYAHHISPFWAHQPENADMFGAVARDPSYLYQYLMSFPYRLFSALALSQTTIVIIFRFINIGLSVGGLVLMRRLLLETRASVGLVNAALLVFVLLPIVPMQAAQINYDNLFLPAVALALLLTVKFNSELKKRQLNAKTVFALAITCLLASLVKYAFLPIFIAIIVFAVVRLCRLRHSFKLGPALAKSWQQMSGWLKVVLVTILIISFGLFLQRIGYNVVRYHTPVPGCAKVLTREQCSEYGPWIRNYNLKLAKLPGPHSPLTFTREWFYGMWLRTMFAVGGPSTDFQSRGPLALPGIGVIFFAVIGLVAFIVTVGKVLELYDPAIIWLFLTTIIIYVVLLWLDEYQAYVQTGQPVAINGRYLLPILLPVIFLMVVATAELIRHKPRLQLWLATLTIVCLAWGGGALTFILRSNDGGWYWPNNAVKTANHAVQDVIGPITPSYHNPALFLK